MANFPGDRLPGALGKRVIYHRGTLKRLPHRCKPWLKTNCRLFVRVLCDEDGVNFCEFGGRKAEIREGGDILLHLLDAAGADQGAGQAGIAQNPSEGQLSSGLSARLSQFIDRARLREAFLADIVLLQESVRLSDTGISGDAVEIAVREQTLCERTEGDAADAFLL